MTNIEHTIYRDTSLSPDTGHAARISQIHKRSRTGVDDDDDDDDDLRNYRDHKSGFHADAGDALYRFFSSLVRKWICHLLPWTRCPWVLWHVFVPWPKTHPPTYPTHTHDDEWVSVSLSPPFHSAPASPEKECVFMVLRRYEVHTHARQHASMCVLYSDCEARARIVVKTCARARAVRKCLLCVCALETRSRRPTSAFLACGDKRKFTKIPHAHARMILKSSAIPPLISHISSASTIIYRIIDGNVVGVVVGVRCRRWRRLLCYFNIV